MPLHHSREFNKSPSGPLQARTVPPTIWRYPSPSQDPSRRVLPAHLPKRSCSTGKLLSVLSVEFRRRIQTSTPWDVTESIDQQGQLWPFSRPVTGMNGSVRSGDVKPQMAVPMKYLGETSSGGTNNMQDSGVQNGAFPREVRIPFKDVTSIIYIIYIVCICIPGTQLTRVLIGKGHILGGWWSKIEVIQVLGIYNLYIYIHIFDRVTKTML